HCHFRSRRYLGFVAVCKQGSENSESATRQCSNTSSLSTTRHRANCSPRAGAASNKDGITPGGRATLDDAFLIEDLPAFVRSQTCQCSIDRISSAVNRDLSE